jgi:hypothetical protein
MQMRKSTFPFARTEYAHACPVVSFNTRLTTTGLKCRIKININILRQPYPRLLPAVLGRHPEGWCQKSAEGPYPQGDQTGRVERLRTINFAQSIS